MGQQGYRKSLKSRKRVFDARRSQNKGGLLPQFLRKVRKQKSEVSEEDWQGLLASEGAEDLGDLAVIRMLNFLYRFGHKAEFKGNPLLLEMISDKNKRVKIFREIVWGKLKGKIVI